jgi:hypothetical protein
LGKLLCWPLGQGLAAFARIVESDSHRAAYHNKLAKYKLPRDFVFVDALPRRAYGKVGLYNPAAVRPGISLLASWIAGRSRTIQNYPNLDSLNSA